MTHKFELGPNQKKWVEALKSGNYKQNHDGYLRTSDDEFCCLGVAIDLFDKDSWVKPYNDPDFYYSGENNNFEVATLKIIDTLKLNSNVGTYFICQDEEDMPKEMEYFIRDIDVSEGNIERIMMSPDLACMNDNNVSFEKIAEFIEKFPEYVFSEAA